MKTDDQVEPEEMNGRVLGIIGAYGIGARPDPGEEGTTPADTPDAGLGETEDPPADAIEEHRARRIA